MSQQPHQSPKQSVEEIAETKDFPPPAPRPPRTLQFDAIDIEKVTANMDDVIKIIDLAISRGAYKGLDEIKVVVAVTDRLRISTNYFVKLYEDLRKQSK